jgi:hypothetical protein
VRHISARLTGEYARLPVIQNVAVAQQAHPLAGHGPLRWPMKPVSENDDVGRP